jgi:hypothetical protein
MPALSLKCKKKKRRERERERERGGEKGRKRDRIAGEYLGWRPRFVSRV